MCRYDREPQYDFLRPCLQELGDDDGNDDVGQITSKIHYSFTFIYIRTCVFIIFIQDIFEDDVLDAVSDDGSWHSDNDDSDAEKPPTVVAKRPSKASALKKTATQTVTLASAKTAASVSQSHVDTTGSDAVSNQDLALSVPASMHMPAVPFEVVDDLWIEGVDEDYGDD